MSEAAQRLTAIYHKVALSLQGFRRSKLLSNATIYIGGTMLQKAFGFLLIPLYTRYLTPADYGIIGLGAAISGVLALLIGLGIYSGVARMFYDYLDDPVTLRRYISTNSLFLFGVTVLSVTMLLMFGQPVWDSLTSGQVAFKPYVQLMVLGAGVDALAQLPLVLYRTEQRAAAFVIAQISMFVLRAGAVIYFVVYLGMGAAGQMTGDLMASAAVAGVLLLLLARRYGTLHIHRDYLAMTLAYSLPLLPHLLSAWALGAIDRLMLESRVSLTELGLYNLGYQLALVMNVLIFSFNQAYSPYYYGLMKTRQQPEFIITRIIRLFVAGMGALCLVGILFAAEFVRWIAPIHYAGAEVYVPPILFGYLLLGLYNFSIAPIFYYKHTRIVPQITLVAAALNIVLNLWWIPLIGALGAAWATACAYGLSFSLAFIRGRKYQKIPLPYPSLAVAVGLVFMGVLYAIYVAPLIQVPISALALKAVILLVYAIYAYLWLVRPVLATSRFGKEGLGA
ncbi:oligosaccharide flippase family protein [Candidatus Chloroploca asiatica]|uniref:Uncharacterized protein n=1 Tax=Candidatus Chloroploca asiatica TaxID=1506545 RepID=A0A2H3KPB6_9CHLR|nr:oligosaccharide flippase family protein [Candidatus Chloroploca asiatica]PDV99983.1 hypothetical protein A9Q02_11150 [Candidatus Chloroploca asiatica]